MDEDAMPLGAALHVEMATRSLSTPVGSARPCADSAGSEGEDGQAQCAQGAELEGDD